MMFFIKNGIAGYRKAFCYKGVAGRRDYFFFMLFQGVVFGLQALASFYISSVFRDSSNVQAAPVILAVIGFFIVLAIGIYSWLAGLAFSARRLHDTGLSGWILLIPALIALGAEAVGEGGRYVINFVFSLGLMLAKTKTEGNKYQPDSTSKPDDVAG